MSRLQTLGFGDFFRSQMDKLPDQLRPARIVGMHRRQWDVASEEGTERAVLAGRRWDPHLGRAAAQVQPTIGDWVALRGSAESETATEGARQELPVIEHILERRTWLTRTSLAKRGAPQTLVANVDIIAVVAAFAREDAGSAEAARSLNPRRIERFLTAIEKGRAQPLVLLNKSDLSEDAEREAQALEQRLTGCPVRVVNCVDEEGLAPLRAWLEPGITIGFVGLSGVGKSSLVNRLLGKDVQRVHAERASDLRGRHTTTHRELFQTDAGFLLIDTPGMREFALVGHDEADLDAFRDITELAQGCQFRDCAHRDEPGCRVLRAVDEGHLERDRLESFRTLAEELRKAEKVRSLRPPMAKQRRSPHNRRRRSPSDEPWEDE